MASFGTWAPVVSECRCCYDAGRNSCGTPRWSHGRRVVDRTGHRSTGHGSRELPCAGRGQLVKYFRKKLLMDYVFYLPRRVDQDSIACHTPHSEDTRDASRSLEIAFAPLQGRNFNWINISASW